MFKLYTSSLFKNTTWVVLNKALIQQQDIILGQTQYIALDQNQSVLVCKQDTALVQKQLIVLDKTLFSSETGHGSKPET